MTQNEFVLSAQGKPWVNRASSFDGMDCYGLVMLYYKEVLGIDLPEPEGYSELDDISLCWEKETSSGRWEPSDRPTRNAIVFTAYRGNTPLHVGVMLDHKRAIHCRGDCSIKGKVEIHSIRAIESIYGKVSFHRYIG